MTSVCCCSTTTTHSLPLSFPRRFRCKLWRAERENNIVRYATLRGGYMCAPRQTLSRNEAHLVVPDYSYRPSLPLSVREKSAIKGSAESTVDVRMTKARVRMEDLTKHQICRVWSDLAKRGNSDVPGVLRIMSAFLSNPLVSIIRGMLFLYLFS